MDWGLVLSIIIPLIIIEVGFRIFAVISILKHPSLLMYFSKRTWIILVSVIYLGWVFYWLYGRKPAPTKR